MSATLFDQANADLVHVGTVTVGASQSYYFRQQLSDDKPASCNLRRPKQIIPSVPRTRTRPPPGSSLSPIRSHKLPRRGPSCPLQESSTHVSPQRSLVSIPLPHLPAVSLPSRPSTKHMGRKVSFDTQVVIVHTVFNGDDEDADGHNGGSSNTQDY